MSVMKSAHPEPRQSERSERDPTSHPVLLYDGVCNLCNASVRWVLAVDRRQVFRFASLQSPVGEALARRAGAPTSPGATVPDSFVLVDGERAWIRSDALLEAARRLGAPWSWALMLRVFPRGFRDAIYSWIARNRYRWFGKQETCPLPSPEQRARFLDVP